jgi:hypothetical protein
MARAAARAARRALPLRIAATVLTGASRMSSAMDTGGGSTGRYRRRYDDAFTPVQPASFYPAGMPLLY